MTATPKEMTKRAFRSSFLLLLSLMLLSCAERYQVYVSARAEGGGTGSKKDPFSTIEAARDHVRKKRVLGERGNYAIILREGDYFIREALRFTEQDSGLQILPYRDERVTFKGSISIDPSSILPVSGTEKDQLSGEEKGGDILMVPLKELNITDYGTLHPVGFQRPVTPAGMELFIDGQPGQLARWPNDSMIAIGKVLDRGAVAAEGDQSNRGAVFTYETEQPSGWSTPEEIWISGYFRYGWADDAIGLASIDTVKKMITTLHPHRYGFESGKPWSRWYAYNVKEEMDMAGEYYIDREEGILYFFNPGSVGEIELSLLEEPFIVMNGSVDVTIRGILFENSRLNGVELQGTRRCIIKECTFRNLGGYAISIQDSTTPSADGMLLASRENGVVNCTIHNTGRGGVILSGGDRQTLEPGLNYVENCSIHDFNRIAKTYCGAVTISGVGNRITHNEIYNSPHVAILLTGNDHLIEYNEIDHVCLETDDVGAIYYGRNPSERGNIVRYNYIHDLGDNFRTTAVYHDDGACGITVHGNIFYRAGRFPVLIGGGSDNSYTNNIFIDCQVAIKVDNRMEAFEWAKGMIAPGGVIEQRLAEIRHDQPPYSVRYPELANYWNEDPAFPKRNRVDRNLFVNVNQVILKVHEGVNANKPFLDFTRDNWITHEDPGFVDKENQNFTLRPGSAVFEKIPRFEPVPFEKMGRETDQ